MRRIAALAMSTLVSLGAVATLAATPATAGSSDTRTACPAAKKSKSSGSSGSSGMDMRHGHSKSNKDKKKSAMTNCPTVAGAPEIELSASAFSFTPADITIEAGEPVTIVLSSTDLEHDFTVRKYGHVVHTKPNKTARGGLVIDEPGTYKYWCTVKGHRAQGMVGTVTVTPTPAPTTTP